jgi:hypothetical protein
MIGIQQRQTRFTSNSFLANMTATVFMLLRLNAIMSVIFNVPAAVFSTVRGSLFDALLVFT